MSDQEYDEYDNEDGGNSTMIIIVVIVSFIIVLLILHFIYIIRTQMVMERQIRPQIIPHKIQWVLQCKIYHQVPLG